MNRYASVNGTSFAYDGRGNLTNNGANGFTYDLENHLLTITAGANTKLSAAYDPTGRPRQTVGSDTIQFLYAGDMLVAKFDDSSSTLRQRYVPGANADEPLVWYEGGDMNSTARRWLHTDHQGSIVATSGDNGARRNRLLLASRQHARLGRLAFSIHRPDHRSGQLALLL